MKSQEKAKITIIEYELRGTKWAGKLKKLNALVRRAEIFGITVNRKNEKFRLKIGRASCRERVYKAV